MKLGRLLLAAWLLLGALPAFSQGCAMCYSSAAGVSHDGQQAINRAVLVLLVPPAAFMTLGLAAAYRYSKKRDLEQWQTHRGLDRKPGPHVDSLKVQPFDQCIPG